MPTNRKAQRFPAYRCAHIVLAGGNQLIKCAIRDLSEKGAALEVHSAASIPSRFDLLFEDEEMVYGLQPKLERKMVLRACAVAWSSGEKFGVSFA